MMTSPNRVSPAAYDNAFDYAIAAGFVVPLWAEAPTADDPDAVDAAWRFVGEVGTSSYNAAMNERCRLEALGWAWERDVDQNVWMMAPELFALVDQSGDFWLNDYTAERAEDAAYMFRRIRGFDIVTGEPE